MAHVYHAAARETKGVTTKLDAASLRLIAAEFRFMETQGFSLNNSARSAEAWAFNGGGEVTW